MARIFLFATCWLMAWAAFAQTPPPVDDATCLGCHDDAGLVKTLPGGATVSLFVSPKTFSQSVHAGGGCVFCHADVKEVPHPETLKPVACDGCHGAEAALFTESLHGAALAKGDPLAPSCHDCHSKHDIRTKQDPKSKTNPIHIPEMCGGCHAEDAPVARERNIAEHNILQNYEESVHGEGLLKKGLKGTAVCTSCHTAHHVLPHTDPRSAIGRANIVSTCTQCHALIEEVHRKIINSELWEKDPSVIPVCIDCHQPHKARKVYYDEGVSDRDCLMCHGKEVQGSDKTLPPVDANQMAGFRHGAVRCAQCHTKANPSLARPCETIASSVDCSICHEEQVSQHARSSHGQLQAKGDPDAPGCLNCHEPHDTRSKADPLSPTFPSNVPALCGKCHDDGEKAAARGHQAESSIVRNYATSIHGKGLLASGLLVTATCTSCHTAHAPLPSSDPASSINAQNIPAMCGRCHSGVEKVFAKSVHSPAVTTSGKPLPTCNDCHTSHGIRRTDEDAFKQEIVSMCGSCHEDVTQTYFDTYHGKVSRSGTGRAAKCHDCHGAHDILPISDPHSRLSHDNIVATCAQCHPGSHRQFAGYLTHATHHDPQKYPALFLAFWGMTALLTGTFAVFGLHTLIWLPRSFREMMRRRSQNKQGEPRMFRRFDPIVRQLHFVLILSFFGLALTGMALKFSYMPWALWLAKSMGGFHAAGVIHRICAVIMLIDFVIHIGVIVHRKRESGISWKELLLGPSSLIPNMTDARQFGQTLKWLVRLGPQPRYGEWTYWEKFDYFAVFWGVAIIGSTGFMLWFPELCTRVLPGWMINVATIVHSDEALLAVGFIFTIHFFNTHFRPEKFPMDMAMFTGLVSEEELKHERPEYYARLIAEGNYEKRIVAQAPKEFRFWAALFGGAALATGFAMVLFILWSMIYGYR
ncbi:MAG TPA: cytochrome c3 family protein [Candidatus Hydrogenedentes bacterium]|nr:cytochrome c3 family protein [Candidatus Hydrogenedentota bacterium]HOS02999.1 cytochrome c3 family protein [Candidatus Hydrogenedentota bacterium]